MNEIKNAIITKFGGVNVVARICGVTAGAVSQWVDIPARHQRRLLAAAPKHNVEMTPYDFFMVIVKP